MWRGILIGWVFFLASAMADKDCGVHLIIRPGETTQWRAFKRNSPPFSIAIDGYVEGPTRRDLAGPRATFDHHRGVDRLSTGSVDDQLEIEIAMGMLDRFQKDGKRLVFLHMNDCDQDICASVRRIRKPEIVFANNPRERNFLYANDRMDRTAGTFPLSDPEMLMAREWVFQPYNAAKMSGALDRKVPAEYESIIDAVGQRIDLYVAGQMPDTAYRDDYEVHAAGTLPNGAPWMMVRELGSGARLRLVREGVRAYVFEFPNGKFSIGRTSDWVPFPLDKIYAALNAAEPPGLITEHNKWGGSDTIGGSPRGTGSRLSATQVAAVIQRVLDAGGF